MYTFFTAAETLSLQGINKSWISNDRLRLPQREDFNGSTTTIGQHSLRSLFCQSTAYHWNMTEH